jgi:hypothetical protein
MDIDMKFHEVPLLRKSGFAALLLCCTSLVWAASTFNSGSTGADGAFNPTTNTTLTMPDSGVFNFTTVNIPVNVTVKFKKNAGNTPVIILATGDVTIAGAIDVSGGQGGCKSGYVGIDCNSLPGVGGPGGFDGGVGGHAVLSVRGGNGMGPGGGGGGDTNPGCCGSGYMGTNQSGGGAGYAATGSNNFFGTTAGNTGLGGLVYGSNLLLPLIGGSGGGGGSGFATANMTGNGFGGSGGGGGGAIMIVSAGTLSLTGSVVASGGSGRATGLGPGNGGGGSGGAVRLVAPMIAGNILNSVVVSGGSGPVWAGNGSSGRVNYEMIATGTLSYYYLTTIPTLTIASVGGLPAPATPTGHSDIVFSDGSPSAAQVIVNTTNVPPGSTVLVTLIPDHAPPVTTTSAPLAGTLASATASANIDVPVGSSTLTATTSYTLTTAMGEALSVFAEGERVDQVRLAASYGGHPATKLITVTGKQFDASPEALKLLGSGG